MTRKFGLRVRRVKFGRFFLPVLVALALPAWAAPTVRQVQRQRDDRYVVRGEGFDTHCAKCEAIAVYSDGFRYALTVERWTDREIDLRLPDLNRGYVVGVTIYSTQGVSAPVSVQLQPQIASPTQLRSLAPAVASQFEHSSDLKVGDRGEELIAVGIAAPRCGERAWMFERAELKHLRQRFGEAQIVSQPPPCIDCAPLRVRWYHEPTGYLQFQVSIFRRAIEGVCSERVR
jgi:hypothetical protein